MKFDGSIFKEDKDENVSDLHQKDDIKTDWPAFINEKRAGLNMSQKDLAKKAGVGEATIKAWNKGGGMHVESLEYVLQVLGYELKAVKND